MDRDWVEQQASECLGPDDHRPGLDQDQFDLLLAAIRRTPKDPAGVVRVAYDFGLGHPDAAVRLWAITFLRNADLRLPDDLDSRLIAVLGDDDHMVQAHLLNLLDSQLQRYRDCTRIARVLEHFSLVQDDGNRAKAVRLWRKLTRDAAGYGVPPLARALRDRSPIVREQVASVLGWLGEDEAREAAPDLARAGVADDEPTVRRAAMRALIEVEPNPVEAARLLHSSLGPDGWKQVVLELRAIGTETRQLREAIKAPTRGDNGVTNPPPPDCVPDARKPQYGPDSEDDGKVWWGIDFEPLEPKPFELLKVVWGINKPTDLFAAACKAWKQKPAEGQAALALQRLNQKAAVKRALQKVRHCLRELKADRLFYQKGKTIYRVDPKRKTTDQEPKGN